MPKVKLRQDNVRSLRYVGDARAKIAMHLLGSYRYLALDFGNSRTDAAVMCAATAFRCESAWWIWGDPIR